MRTLPLILASAVALCGCGEDDAAAVDAGVSCEQPAFVTLDEAYDVFTYEASARADGSGACSVAGALPRHTITWDDASAACAAEGWRLCTAAELRRACAGPQGNAFTWGNTFRGGVCNLREAYTLPDGDGRAGPAPCGAFPDCVSAEGLHDLTGNLWEWVSDAPPSDPAGHIYQGAGWKTIAQMHHDENQACDAQSTLVAAFATTYADDHVGFPLLPGRAVTVQANETQVRFQLRWLLLLISVVVLVLLRNDRLALALYVGAVVLAVAAWVLMVPRRVAEAERRFHREALRCLANDDYPGLTALADKQWLLKRFGRKHVLPDTLGLAAAASGDHAVARRLYLEALGHAPPEERARIELNLAGEEMALGLLDAAEGRYRSVLARRPVQSMALANLGRILLQKGEELTEAAGLLRRAAPLADPREADELLALADEAEARAGRRRV